MSWGEAAAHRNCFQIAVECKEGAAEVCFSKLWFNHLDVLLGKEEATKGQLLCLWHMCCGCLQASVYLAQKGIHRRLKAEQ